jgi:hypothetical protein
VSHSQQTPAADPGAPDGIERIVFIAALLRRGS